MIILGVIKNDHFRLNVSMRYYKVWSQIDIYVRNDDLCCLVKWFGDRPLGTRHCPDWQAANDRWLPSAAKLKGQVGIPASIPFLLLPWEPRYLPTPIQKGEKIPVGKLRAVHWTTTMALSRLGEERD